jgi:hypothetical protein
MNRGTNMKAFFAALMTLLLIAGAALAASPDAEVRLALDEKNILPATPTGLRITVLNHGREQLQLPPSISLIATDAAGKTFTLRVLSLARSLAAPVPQELRAVPVDGSQQLRFDPSNAVAGSPWLMDERLWKPGSYRLRAVLAPEVRPDGTFDATTALVSNEESLTVIAPTDDDAAVWRWMQRQKWNEQAWIWRGGQLAKFVMREHPKSQYALFIALYVPQNDGPVPLHSDLVARYPNHSFTDQVRLLQIQAYQRSIDLAYRQADLYRAANESDQARAIASDLVRNSRSSNVRAFAKELLDRTPPREQLMKRPESR